MTKVPTRLMHPASQILNGFVCAGVQFAQILAGCQRANHIAYSCRERAANLNYSTSVSCAANMTTIILFMYSRRKIVTVSGE